jgi:mRNA-degrading endonuclease toxin of MazEF toxin-antitoxin module
MITYVIRLLEWCRMNLLLIESHKDFHFNEGEVWWCSVGLNIGEEEFGKGLSFERPVLIFKKFTRNSFLGLPLTSHRKEGSWYVSCEVARREGSVMLNQARIFDRARLLNYMARVKDDELFTIRERFRKLYCP